MRKSSFGLIKTCKHGNNTVEYLEFEKEGRFHQHKETEYFTVLKGEGLLITNKETLPIVEGETYLIPPKTPHKMKPITEKLTILLSYGV